MEGSRRCPPDEQFSIAKSGISVAHSFKKFLTCKHILPQSLAQAVRVIASQTYRVVVVYFYIFKTVVAEHIYDLLLEIRLDRRK